ncbi:hypothetical protein D3C76_1679600 [compost metagenome]
MYSSLLSWDSSRPRGRWPTGNVSVTSRVCRSIRLSVLSFSFETQAVAAAACPLASSRAPDSRLGRNRARQDRRRMAYSLLLWLSAQG